MLRHYRTWVFLVLHIDSTIWVLSSPTVKEKGTMVWQRCEESHKTLQNEMSPVQVLALTHWNMNLHFHDSMLYVCSLILLIAYASYLIPSYRCLQLYFKPFSYCFFISFS